ncbi:5'/3'-nucleotidase SurE [Phormidium tenue FACHB-886]|nr:5'/3'-nucleotidase SurE [Phormidium tenue FACHB-886]
MKLLISNDDGIYALGVRTLANTLALADHEVIVVCPDRERSATGHGLTIHDPIRAERIEALYHPSIKAWACSGTPSDCVKLGLGALLESPPDMVLSGINHGANLGTDVLYSGTVSAAMEGILEGIPSIAFSLTNHSSQEFQPAAAFAVTLAEHLYKHPLPQLTLLSVNVPAIPADQVAGVVMTRQGVRRYFDMFEKRVDPRGRTYYWLSGEVIEDIDEPNPESLEMATLKAAGRDLDWFRQAPTDVQANRQNYIAITPLQYNLTCASGLASLQGWQLPLPANR